MIYKIILNIYNLFIMNKSLIKIMTKNDLFMINTLIRNGVEMFFCKGYSSVTH